MVIYKMVNTHNGRVYIGQNVRDVDVRMKEHFCHSTIIVDKAVQKYGVDAFEIEVIDCAETIEELNQKEQYWIQYYDCIIPKGYNQCLGGDNTMGYHHQYGYQPSERVRIIAI